MTEQELEAIRFLRNLKLDPSQFNVKALVAPIDQVVLTITEEKKHDNTRSAIKLVK